MSKFKIYRAKSSDPDEAGRRNKRLYIVYVIFFFLLLLTINLYFEFENDKSSLIIYYSGLSMSICIIAFVIYRMKRQMNDLETIGTIEFTKNCIKKEIGDLSETYTYDDLLQIEVEKYLRDLSVSGNKHGSSVYILKIIKKNSSRENFIISGRSLDFRQKMGISATLNTVKSMTGLKTVVNESSKKSRYVS